MIQMNLFTKRNRLIDLENKFLVARGKVRRKGYLGNLGSMYIHDYILNG